MVPFVQSMLLARHLRGDLDAYPPFSGSKIVIEKECIARSV